MKRWQTILLCSVVALVTWIAASVLPRAHAQSQGTAGSPVRITGLGATGNLPLQSDGTAYLPVLQEDRQLMFDTEAWQKNGDVMSLLINRTTVPRRIVLCGHRLAMIQGSMRPVSSDESFFFPLTVNGTGLAAANDGCVSITPVAYLRIKGVTTIPNNQLPSVVVVASY